MQLLLEDLDVQRSQVMAVGDGENDMEMLQLAGVSVAMDNATPSIKVRRGA